MKAPGRHTYTHTHTDAKARRCADNTDRHNIQTVCNNLSSFSSASFLPTKFSFKGETGAKMTRLKGTDYLFSLLFFNRLKLIRTSFFTRQRLKLSGPGSLCSLSVRPVWNVCVSVPWGPLSLEGRPQLCDWPAFRNPFLQQPGDIWHWVHVIWRQPHCLQCAWSRS